MQLVKPSIYEFVDYRKFLQTYYLENKRRNPAFSLRFFGQRAGLKSYNYLKLVIEGKRRLTPTFLDPFSRALNLDSMERRYLEQMVQFVEEPEYTTKATQLDKLLKLRPK